MQKDNRPASPCASPGASADIPRVRTALPPAAAGTHVEPTLHPGEGVWVGASRATRREFAAAASATMAAFAMGIPLARAARADDAQGPDAADQTQDAGETPADEGPVGIDEQGNVDVIANFTDLIEETDYEPVASYTLPVGCNVCADCETRAAVVQANGGGRPFTVVGCLDYATGEYTVVVPEPVSGSDFAPSDARITDSLIAWVEVDNSTDRWAFYAAPFAGAPVSVGTYGLVKLGEGDADWLPPLFDVAGSRVVWQVMPDPYGTKTREYSHAYLWTLGAGEGTEDLRVPGPLCLRAQHQRGRPHARPAHQARRGRLLRAQGHRPRPRSGGRRRAGDAGLGASLQGHAHRRHLCLLGRGQLRLWRPAGLHGLLHRPRRRSL